MDHSAHYHLYLTRSARTQATAAVPAPRYLPRQQPALRGRRRRAPGRNQEPAGIIFKGSGLRAQGSGGVANCHCMMMRYRYMKGSKIEVLNKRELPSRSWRCAEIISGNGHMYRVRFDDCSSPEERVPRKAIRPCPPPTQGRKNWASGDMVEVFRDDDGRSWKLAQLVLRCPDVGGIDNNYVVRLVGSSEELGATESNLRVPLNWQGDGWVVIDKDNEVIDHVFQANKKRRTALVEKEEGMELGICYSGGSNNTPTPTYVSMASTGSGSGSESESGSREPSPSPSPSPSLTDVYRSTMSVFHASGPLDWKKEAMLSDLRLMFHIPDDEHRLHLKHLFAASQTEEEGFAPKSQQALHILEFDAYCSTMSAFHASGPLTMEREVMLSNLRLLLHISDAEHRLQLWHLATTAKAST